MSTEIQYSMKKVIERTGLTDHAIRVWERRYQAVVPSRTESKRRMYTDNDIAKLQFLKILTDSGHSIRNIAHMDIELLSRLVVLENKKNASKTEIKNKDFATDQFIENCIEYLKSFDTSEFEKVFCFVERQMLLENFLMNFVEPLLVRIGLDWEKGNIKIAHEHLASAVIRKVLAAKLSEINPKNSTYSILFTTPAGQLHEMGVLISALLAADHGIHAIFLGPNLPAKDIAFSANHNKGISMIVLSVLYPINDIKLLDEFENLRIACRDNIQIAIGGSSLDFYKGKIDKLKFITLNNFNDCIDIYEQIQQKN